jgi:deoxyribodipyrimidine photo-lyase
MQLEASRANVRRIHLAKTGPPTKRDLCVTEAQRLTDLNGAPELPGAYVLYWMQHSQRAEFNPALETAIAAGNRLRLPVLVGFGLTENYPEANARHYAFMLEGLAETERTLRARGLGFVIRLGSPDDVALGLARRAALVVCDRGYLRQQRHWRARVAAEAGRRVLQVEGDVVVPVELVSPKPEIGARTLRPKLLRLRDEFLCPLSRNRVREIAQRLDLGSDIDLTNVSALLERLRIPSTPAPVEHFHGGYTEAKRRLGEFIAHRLQHYVRSRAHPAAADISTLSPYLHFGQISPVEVALAVREAQVAEDNRASFLEELIVRRELAANFVQATPNYDSYDCVPEWARRTLDAHNSDHREHIYGFDQLARADTHDPSWNAAMSEMLVTGFMHNYMRMYWGKKVLEWSPSPEEGYATLLRLNNTFFLDGRDANSYANVGWVFGLHDRPWPERPIFGKVRSMTEAGLRRKADIDDYVRKMATAAGG